MKSLASDNLITPNIDIQGSKKGVNDIGSLFYPTKIAMIKREIFSSFIVAISVGARKNRDLVLFFLFSCFLPLPGLDTSSSLMRKMHSYWR